MSKPQRARRCCRSGWNGRLRRARETVSAVTCVLKSSSHAAKVIRNLLFKTATLCLLLGVLPGQASSADQATAFIYHRFSDSRYPSTSIPLHDFRAHLEILQQEGFTVLKLGDVIGRLQNGNSLPDRCAVLTVDDAYRTFLDVAWPLLKEFGFPVTIFVNTDMVGAGDFMSWDDLRQVVAEGGEIGNHSAAHGYMLDRLKNETDADWRTRIGADLKRSQNAFVTQLGSVPDLFAYPYGEFSPELEAVVKDAGFRAAFGQQSGVISSDQDNYQLPRFPMGGSHTSASEFRSKLFMRHLPVDVINPRSPVISNKWPPVLEFSLDMTGMNKDSLRCYTAGGRACRVRAVDEKGHFEAVSDDALTGRRGKYTLTASDMSGKRWYWYSQLWVHPHTGAVSDDSVPR